MKVLESLEWFQSPSWLFVHSDLPFPRCARWVLAAEKKGRLGGYLSKGTTHVHSVRGMGGLLDSLRCLIADLNQIRNFCKETDN
jgi:hypothetical protein